MKLMQKLAPITTASAIAVSTMLVPAVSHAEFTGNIGVVSNYVLRGITNPDSPIGSF